MSEDHDSTPISELDESTSLNANDEFIISTKDSNEVYSSKKVKLSTVHNSVPSPPAGIQGITVKEEGTTLATDATSLNFVGSTVTASGTGAEKTITITEPAGGGGGSGMKSSTHSSSVTVPGALSGWSDLDISSAVGVNKAFVMIQFQGGSQSVIFIRPKSNDNWSPPLTLNNYEPSPLGSSGGYINNVTASILTCITNSSGVLQIAGNESSNASYKILCYQVLS